MPFYSAILCDVDDILFIVNFCFCFIQLVILVVFWMNLPPFALPKNAGAGIFSEDWKFGPRPSLNHVFIVRLLIIIIVSRGTLSCCLPLI